MKTTTNANMNLPEYADIIDIQELNENFETIDSHLGNQNNPHCVTAEQVGAMATSVYDKNGKAEDIFDYVDSAAQDIRSAIPSNVSELNNDKDYMSPIPVYQITLPKSDWESNSQQVTNYYGSTDCLIIPMPAETSLDEYVSCGVYCSAESEKYLTFSANTTPAGDLDIDIAFIPSAIVVYRTPTVEVNVSVE
jgi:hypothetical protein